MPEKPDSQNQLKQSLHGSWSLASLQPRLVKTGGRLVSHSPYYWLLLAESHLTRRMFGAMVRRIAALLVAGFQAEFRL